MRQRAAEAVPPRFDVIFYCRRLMVGSHNMDAKGQIAALSGWLDVELQHHEREQEEEKKKKNSGRAVQIQGW